jgi:hypothetical protein
LSLVPVVPTLKAGDRQRGLPENGRDRDHRAGAHTLGSAPVADQLRRDLRVEASVKQRLKWIVGCLGCVALGGFYLYSSGRVVIRDMALAGDPPVAEATVTHRTLNSKGPGVHSVDVRFVTDDGRPVRGTVYEFRKPPPAVGAALSVRYSAAHPSEYVRDAASGPSVWYPVLLIPLGLAVTALGIAMLARPELLITDRR